MMPHVSANAGVSIELKNHQIGHSQNTYNLYGFENQKRRVIFASKRDVEEGLKTFIWIVHIFVSIQNSLIEHEKLRLTFKTCFSGGYIIAGIC